MGTLEVVVEDAFVDYAASKGCKAWKLHEDVKGWPDRSVQMPWGTIDFHIEFKKPGGGVVSRQQEKKIAEIRRRNGTVYILDDLEEAKAVLDSHLKKGG